MGNELLKGRKVLIVDDDFASRLYLNKVLEKAGVILLNAVNGQEAVNLALNNPDIDIILMDLQLPVMDGYTSAGLIREFRKNVIIIAQTAYIHMLGSEKFADAGFNDYLIKPILFESLLEKLVSHLSK